MSTIPAKAKWRSCKNTILNEWIDFLHIFNILSRDVLLALVFSSFLFIISSLPNRLGQHWPNEAIKYIHEVASIAFFLSITVIDLYKFLKKHIAES